MRKIGVSTPDSWNEDIVYNEDLSENQRQFLLFYPKYGNVKDTLFVLEISDGEYRTWKTNEGFQKLFTQIKNKGRNAIPDVAGADGLTPKQRDFLKYFEETKSLFEAQMKAKVRSNVYKEWREDVNSEFSRQLEQLLTRSKRRSFDPVEWDTANDSYLGMTKRQFSFLYNYHTKTQSRTQLLNDLGVNDLVFQQWKKDKNSHFQELFIKIKDSPTNKSMSEHEFFIFLSDLLNKDYQPINDLNLTPLKKEIVLRPTTENDMMIRRWINKGTVDLDNVKNILIDPNDFDLELIQMLVQVIQQSSDWDVKYLDNGKIKLRPLQEDQLKEASVVKRLLRKY